MNFFFYWAQGLVLWRVTPPSTTTTRSLLPRRCPRSSCGQCFQESGSLRILPGVLFMAVVSHLMLTSGRFRVYLAAQCTPSTDTHGFYGRISVSRRCLQRKIVLMLERSQSLLHYHNNIVNLQHWYSTDHGTHTAL